MVYQGFFEIFMITLISSKNLGGYKIMRNTVISPKGSYLPAKMSFLKCEIDQLTGYDLSQAGLYSQVSTEEWYKSN